MLVNRRLFLQSIGSTSVSQLFGIPFSGSESLQDHLSQITPINPLRNPKEHLKITGDNPHLAHQVLWDPTSYFKANPSKPLTSETTNVVVIGGGISGLSAAWHLREQHPILLEQAPRFGGNAKGEMWHHTTYGLGAAYIVKPDENSDIHKLLNEIGALEKLRPAHLEVKTLFDNEPLKPFNQLLNESTSQQKKAWQRLKSALLHYANETEGKVFPEIPTDSVKHRQYINALDQVSFRDHLLKLANGNLPSFIESYLEQYCWSAFGATMNELSAASGINFLAGEFDDLLVGPGGNAWIAECLLRALFKTLPSSHFRTQSLVYSVEVIKDGVLINYLDVQGQAHQIKAKKVVMSCPKFVVKRILKGIEVSRLEAIQKLEYRSYLVSNALISEPLKDDFYELYLLGKSSANVTLTTQQRSEMVGVTDVLYGHFATPSDQQTVLTLYHPLPFTGGRPKVYGDMALTTERKQVHTLLKEKVLPALNLKPTSLQGLRLSRWGHPLPVAKTGLISSGVIDQLRKPFKERVFFAQQDNWALPAIEVALYEGQWAAEMLNKKN